MIAFSAPWVLGGLVAVSVPLILHLVARREPPLVAFPAVRYLEDTARRHQRRFRLQHLLLLVVRMALLAALVLAAAGPTTSGGGAGGHAPAALVLVLDNSLSSAAIMDGAPVLEALRAPAQRILERAGDGDRVWLLTADRIPRTGDPDDLRRQVDEVGTVPIRLDLGDALRAAEALLASVPLPGEVIVLSDLQATAVSAANGTGTVVGVPEGLPPANRGVATVETGSQPWGGAGRISASVVGSDSEPAALTVLVEGRAARQMLVPSGGTASTALPALPAGWHAIGVEIDPDELRLDDAVQVGVRVAAPVAATWPRDESHLAEGAEVLFANGRLARGGELWLDQLGGGASIIFPPADPATLGALNRALLARGSAWQYGARVRGATQTDSSAILDPQQVQIRHILEPVGSEGEILVTAGGAPWMVRTGNLILLASRLEPDWTALPVSAAFMPFLDLLVNRLARGEVARLGTATGEPVLLPDRVTSVASLTGVERVEGGAAWRPVSPGLHWLLRGTDTVGVVEAHPDPRESLLQRMDAGTVAGLWPGAELTTLSRAADLAFTRAARADLRGPLLWLALALAVAELILAGFGRRPR